MLHQSDRPPETRLIPLGFPPDIGLDLAEIDLRQLLVQTLILLVDPFQHNDLLPDQLQLVAPQGLRFPIGEFQLGGRR